MKATTRFIWLAVVMASCLVAEAQQQRGVTQDSMTTSTTNAISNPTPAETRAYSGAFDAISAGKSTSGFSEHIADLFQDQKNIWTAPTRVRLSDTTWLVPLGGIAAGLFATDRQYSASLSQDP